MRTFQAVFTTSCITLIACFMFWTMRGCNADSERELTMRQAIVGCTTNAPATREGFIHVAKPVKR